MFVFLFYIVLNEQLMTHWLVKVGFRKETKKKVSSAAAKSPAGSNTIASATVSSAAAKSTNLPNTTATEMEIIVNKGAEETPEVENSGDTNNIYENLDDDTDLHNRVFISLDCTPKQMQEHKQLMTELKSELTNKLRKIS